MRKRKAGAERDEGGRGGEAVGEPLELNEREAERLSSSSNSSSSSSGPKPGEADQWESHALQGASEDGGGASGAAEAEDDGWGAHALGGPDPEPRMPPPAAERLGPVVAQAWLNLESRAKAKELLGPDVEQRLEKGARTLAEHVANRSAITQSRKMGVPR